MGSQCLKKSPSQAYQPFIGHQNELKQRWPPIRLFKLKKIFQAHSAPAYTLSPESFFSLFPELQNKNYPTTALQRFFDLFDRQRRGHLDWNSFFQALSLCYFAPPETFAALLFSFHDLELQLALSQIQLISLLDDHEWMMLGDVEEDHQDLIPETGMTVTEWMEQSLQWLDYEKMRGLFSIFAEEEMEREMGANFEEINRLDTGGRAVGYLVNSKWFQSWATYMQKQYQAMVGSPERQTMYARTSKTLRTTKTLKTIKTRKTLKSGRSINSGPSHKRIHDVPKLRQLPSLEGKHYNLIHHNLGDRPPPIYNNLLEGQYSEILAAGLVEGRDYVLVSQEVWRRLKLIYGAYPQFRRSGDPDIQIYPKTLRIYPSVPKGLIDYDQQRLCEFSCKASLMQLLSKALNLSNEELKERTFFFKTCGMDRWRPLLDLFIHVGDLTSQQLIFMAAPKISDSSVFAERYCSRAEVCYQLHLGDEFLYSQNKERQRHAILVGQSQQDVVIHFKGTSYIFDLCLHKQLLEERAALLPSRQAPKKVQIQQQCLYPISDSLGLGFSNGIILILMANEALSKLFRFFPLKKSPFLHQLGQVYQAVTSGNHNSAAVVADWIRRYFPDYFHFQLPMAEEFLETLMDRLHNEIGKLDEESPFQPISDYEIELMRYTVCESCGVEERERVNGFILTLPVEPQDRVFYEVIWVPFNSSLIALESVRVGFSLSKNATFAQYKEKFQYIAGLKDTSYALVEIYGSDIIKCYLNALPEAPLQNLLLREEDVIYAFELCLKLDSFISDHYTSESELKPRSLRHGQMIDFYQKQKDQEGEWKFGKIVTSEVENYTHKIMVGVEVREGGETQQVQVRPEGGRVAPFPTRSFKTAEYYHIKCLQRVYNSVANEMQLVNVPFIVVAGNWMRPRQLQLLIYQQVRQQIGSEGRFVLEEAEGGKMPKKQKVRKFREYLARGKPYRLKYTDQQGRCAFCCKLQKSNILPEEEDYVCVGCQSSLDPEEPLFWHIRPYQLRICLDWQSPSSYRLSRPTLHPSYSTALSEYRSPISLEKCLQTRLQGDYLMDPCLHCMEEGRLIVQQQITSSPEKFLILLERGGESNLNRRSIEVDLECFRVEGESYELAGTIALGQKSNSLHYITFLKERGKWTGYEGQTVRPVKKIAVQKNCPLLLLYHKTGSERGSQRK